MWWGSRLQGALGALTNAPHNGFEALNPPSIEVRMQARLTRIVTVTALAQATDTSDEADVQLRTIFGIGL